MPSQPPLSSLTIPAADILRLIQAHLLEAGLSKTARVLSEESGVGLAGSLQHNWQFHCAAGNYAVILELLGLIDQSRAKISNDLVAAVHELAILEVAEAGDYNLAASMLRMVYAELQESFVTSDNNQNKDKGSSCDNISRARLLEQKLADLASRRAKDPQAPVPSDWYYADSKQSMRDSLGKALAKAIPQQPTGRMTLMLQQAIQWQAYTGELPQIKQWWADDEDQGAAADGDTQPKRKKRKRQFDIVLGQVAVDTVVATGEGAGADNKLVELERYAKDPFTVVKLGKKVTCESVAFLPDSSALVTGSSDGLIEIWDAAEQYTQLKLDLLYQKAEEMLGQDAPVTALAVSNDGAMLAGGSSSGQVIVWRIDTGKSLRSFEAHKTGISCLAFSSDASHILTADRNGLVREFGLRASRMLKEFAGHSAFVSHASYQMVGQRLLVVTASGDGTVRLYDYTTSSVVRIMRPDALGASRSKAGSSLLIDAHQAESNAPGSATIHTVLHLHTPASTMIIVPRASRAFLVSYLGDVVRTFDDNSSGRDNAFVAATVSPSNRLLYCVRDDGVCCVFSVMSGELIGSIRDFGEQSTRGSKDSGGLPEICCLVCHPNKNMIAAFSNDARQSRGQVVLWN